MLAHAVHILFIIKILFIWFIIYLFERKDKVKLAQEIVNILLRRIFEIYHRRVRDVF